MIKGYAVSLEICHLASQEDADLLAAQIKYKLNDLDEDVYICTSFYSQVKENAERAKNAEELVSSI